MSLFRMSGRKPLLIWRNKISGIKRCTSISDENVFPDMDKRQFYREQAEKFRDYVSKFPDGNLLSLFNEWAESKDIYGKDRQEIWRIARKLRPSNPLIINENSDDFVRIDLVLKIILDADLKRLDALVEKRRDKTGEGQMK